MPIAGKSIVCYMSMNAKQQDDKKKKAATSDLWTWILNQNCLNKLCQARFPYEWVRRTAIALVKYFSKVEGSKRRKGEHWIPSVANKKTAILSSSQQLYKPIPNVFIYINFSSKNSDGMIRCWHWLLCKLSSFPCRSLVECPTFIWNYYQQ